MPSGSVSDVRQVQVGVCGRCGLASVGLEHVRRGTVSRSESFATGNFTVMALKNRFGSLF